ncbi:hypothetical protein [Sphingomonas sp. Leaf62]|uniref:hypothetical protein n=1 Tax=Sphingomonas sp. Leaf62 TaxID=1736228 RepID=UPI0006F7362E|nr:hypothetical protein [Sphingomonas sp. Leaf62]KQN76532.1 hypothetical protein ASE91_00705 [Sphingomonas sp. Leaf62]
MDHPVAIDDEQEVTATPPLPDDLMAMVVRLIEYAARRVMTARRAIRQAAMDVLRALVSQTALMLILTAQLTVRWTEVAAVDDRLDGDRADRHLHHPPQAWAAP